jgi:hypothetical protein
MKEGKMKRALVALLLATGLSLAVALPAVADPVGNEQPACGDIIGGGAAYNEASEPQNTVLGSISLLEASCINVSYTMYVTYTSNGKEKTKSQTIHGGGGEDPTTLRFSISNVSSDDGTVCVFYQTAKGQNVIDRAPDEGCRTLVADDTDPPGGSDFT